MKKVEDLGDKRKKIQENKRKSSKTKEDIGSKTKKSLSIVDKLSKKIDELKVIYFNFCHKNTNYDHLFLS